MGDTNFHTFIDFGKNEIRACSFNKEIEKIENQFVLTIKNSQSDDLSSQEEIIVFLILKSIIFEFEKF